MSDLLSPPFDTKTAIVVAEDQNPRQRLNVTAFLASGVTAAHPQLVGEAYLDADETSYVPLLSMPVLVFEADGALLRTVRERGLRRALPTALHNSAMFATGHDEANRAAVRVVGGADLGVVGLGLFGPRNGLTETVRGTPAPGRSRASCAQSGLWGDRSGSSAADVNHLLGLPVSHVCLRRRTAQAIVLSGCPPSRGRLDRLASPRSVH